MKKELIGIFICTLLIATTVLPVTGTINVNKNLLKEQQTAVEKQDQTLTLSEQDFTEIENQLIAFGKQLSNAKTQEEKESIFWEIALLYEEYGLLPEGMNAEEVEQLMIDNYSSRFYSSRNSSQKQNYHPGELIIKFKEETEITISLSPKGFITTGIPSIDTLNEKYMVTYSEKIFKEFSIPSLSSIYKFVFSKNVDIYLIMKEYSLDPNVEYSEPNYIVRTCKVSNTIHSDLTKIVSRIFNSGEPVLIPDDPLFDHQWALNQSNDCDIDAPEAWQIETGNFDVVIAIIDTGVDYNHVDLAGNIWNNTDEIPGNGIDDDDNGFIDDVRGWDFFDNDNNPMDDTGHGTHCSGIASAVTNNGIGIAGVSWDSQIMPIDAFDSGGGGDLDDNAKAIYYAVDNNANIISMSWGLYFQSNLLRDAINYAYDQGVVLVAGAGNDDTDTLLYPSAYDNVISVAATDNMDNKAGFSNYGDWVDVAAPGIDILSTTLGNQYKYDSGTSTSCPYVSGLAALLLSKHNQCPYPAQMVKSVIPYTTDEIETDKYIGTGRINAYKALTLEPFAVDLEVIPNWEDAKGTVDIKGAGWGEGLQYFVLEVGDGEHPSSWTVLLNSSTPQGGVLLSLDTTSLDEGLYTLRLKAFYTDDVYSKEILMYVNNEADGIYDADIFVSECYDSSTPGWGVNRFDKIQDGIDKAKLGDTVFVYAGIYPEDIKIKGLLKSSISLIGQNKEWTFIEGSVNISNARKVTVSGFTIRGGYGIAVGYYEVNVFNSPQCTIADNNIIDYYVVNNILVDFSNKMIIRGNTFTRTVYFEWVPPYILHEFSSKSEISDNTLIGPGAIIDVSFGRSNIIYNNTVLGALFAGIVLVFQFNSLIYKNTLNIDVKGFDGILIILGCFRNIIVANTINAPSAIDIQFFQCGNHIYLNNFIVPIYIGGPGLTYDAGINYWYKSEGFFHGKGNYWSYYKEWYNWKYGENPTDENNDGFWDKPYLVNTQEDLGIFNKDRFPFVKPIDIQNITAPFVSYPIPVDGDNWVSVNLSELSFRLEDFQGDKMDYTVETSPFIGSGSGNGVGNGVYSVSVGGLDYSSDYTWFVNATDGVFWTRRFFVFKTQPLMVFDPFEEGWQYRKQITIDHNMITGDLVNFPVLISTVDSDLRDKAQDDGDDILFMNGSGVANRLFHEIELFNDSSGKLVAWVNISVLSSSVDTIFYMYYGNLDCLNQENVIGTWDSNYIHVWHLGNDLTDSKEISNGNNHGTSTVPGKIGYARDLEKDENDYIDFGDMAQPADGKLATITFESWVKPESLSCELMDKYDASKDKGSYQIIISDTGKVVMYAYPWYGRHTGNYSVDSTIVVDNWYYIAGVYNLAVTNNNVDLFVNGFEIPSTLDSNGQVDYMYDGDVTDDLGRKKSEPNFGDGIYDEVRWSKVMRSDEWIETTYNTINDPSNFFSVELEESSP